MAMIKSVQTPFGVSADYWNIGVLMYNKRDKVCQVVLDGYISKAARTGGKQRLYACELTIPFIDSDDVNLKKAYGLIKQNPDWSDASDD